MRRWLTFPAGDADLAGAFDDADSEAGLLIVSGGNEVLSGSHGGMAVLAARVAAAGHPVFRFDRRGIGDSTGVNGGFEATAADIAAALAAFRREKPSLRGIVGFGNCDAATALALFHDGLELDGLVLANPWVIEPIDDLPPPAAIRARYRDKLAKPSEWARLVTGKVDLRKLVKGLRSASATRSASPIADRMRAALAASALPVTIVLARRDATALAFREQWLGEAWRDVRDGATIVEIETASHSFARPDDADALTAAVLGALAR